MTIAMVLAETVASGELLAQDDLRGVEVAPHRPERIKGQRFAEGLAYGQVVLHEPPLAPEQLLSEDPDAEGARLSRPCSRSRPISITSSKAGRASWPGPRSRCSRT